MNNSNSSAKARVLVLHNILWSHYKAVVFSKLFQRAVESGFELCVIHYAETEGKRSDVPERTKALHAYPYTVLRKGTLEGTNPCSLAIRVCTEIWRRKPNVIVLPGYSEFASWCAAALALALRSKIIIAIDSTWQDKRRNHATEWLKRALVSRCDGAFVYGTRASEYATKLGLNQRKIFTRCQATDNDFYASATATLRPESAAIKQRLGIPFDKVALYVGRFAPEKNLIGFIETWLAVREANPELSAQWGLVLAGSGPERDAIQQRASALEIPCVFINGLPWWETPQLYAVADVLVLPSISEPWGLVINEAMASRVPVAASVFCGATPDLIEHGVSGIAFDPTDKHDMVAAITRLIGSQELRDSLAENALRRIQLFSPDSAAKSMARGFDAVLGDANR